MTDSRDGFRDRARWAVGDLWDEMGLLQLEFLRARGLRTDDNLLDVGCGCLRGGVHFARFLSPGRYYGLDSQRWLLEAGRVELALAGLEGRQVNLLCRDDFDCSSFGVTFDFGIAQSVFTHLPLPAIERCLSRVRDVLAPRGQFFATFFEGPSDLESIRHQPGGVVTTSDRDPYHYSFETFVDLAQKTGLHATYVGDWQHPRAQRMMCFVHSTQTTTSRVRAAGHLDSKGAKPNDSPAPIAIGGVGGSGTRVVAECLRSLGVFMGADLNAMNDALWFTLLFTRQEILDATDAEFEVLTRLLAAGLQGGQPLPAHALARIGALAGRDRPQVSADWLRMRARSLAAATSAPPHGGAWGWKEPNTHLVIERLWQHLPSLRYVHVVRHGLDMALSSNQNQVRLWGKRALGHDGDVTPARSLAYWCWAQRRMERILRRNRDRIYWLDYDVLCREPVRTLASLLGSLGFDPQHAGRLAALVHPPKTPRHASAPLDVFSPDDVAYVESLGYPVLSRA